MKLIYLIFASLFLFSCSKKDQVENPSDLVNSKYTHLNVAFDVEEQTAISHYEVLTSTTGTFSTAGMILAGNNAKASYSINISLDRYKEAGAAVVSWKLVTVSIDGSREESAVQSVRLK